MSAEQDKKHVADMGETTLPSTPDKATMEEKYVTEMGDALPDTPRTGLSATEYDPIDPKAERKLLLKLDLVIYPVFFVMYMMSFLDRINISNARIQGMEQELGLDQGNRFNVVLFVSLFSLENIPNDGTDLKPGLLHLLHPL